LNFYFIPVNQHQTNALLQSIKMTLGKEPFGLSCKFTTFFSNMRSQGVILCRGVNLGLSKDFIFSKDWKNQRNVVILHHEST
jgi:hypothetical protein